MAPKKLHSGNTGAELRVTREELLGLIAHLSEVARSSGKRAQSRVGEGATDAQIGRCEAALGCALPDEYVRQLRDWNGCTVEIYERSPQSGEREYQCALFEILDTMRIPVCTEIVIEWILDGANTAKQETGLRRSLAGSFVINYLDDYAAMVGRVPGSNDPGLGVRGVNLILVHEKFPPRLPVIAVSVDEYLRRSLRHLRETLETDLYWR